MQNEECLVDKGAEFIGSAAYLLWLKSKMLLPQPEEPLEESEIEEDPRFEIIHHLRLLQNSIKMGIFSEM